MVTAAVPAGEKPPYFEVELKKKTKTWIYAIGWAMPRLKSRFVRGIENLHCNINNPLGFRLFSCIFSFTSAWDQQRKRLISPEPKLRSPPSPYPLTLAIIFLSLFTGKQRLLFGGSGISHCPLLHLDWSHTRYPVYVQLLMYVWEWRSISLLCWSPHCARVTELKSERGKKKKEKIMM